MSPTAKQSLIIGLAALVGGTIAVRAQHHHAAAATGGLGVPSSLQEEHRELHERLERATRVPGEIGEAAQVVARLLHAHFEAEERVAMPLLGLLAPLAAHEEIDDREAAIAMARELRTALPQMLEEHAAIKNALDTLKTVATHLGDPESIAFAEALMLHARNEEEVLYPSALLVGEVLEAAKAHH